MLDFKAAEIATTEAGWSVYGSERSLLKMARHLAKRDGVVGLTPALYFTAMRGDIMRGTYEPGSYKDVMLLATTSSTFRGAKTAKDFYLAVWHLIDPLYELCEIVNDKGAEL